MTREEMIAELDGEIQRLEKIHELLKRSHSERFTVPEASPATSVAQSKGLRNQAKS